MTCFVRYGLALSVMNVEFFRYYGIAQHEWGTVRVYQNNFVYPAEHVAIGEETSI
jgi:hypothetical protein